MTRQPAGGRCVSSPLRFGLRVKTIAPCQGKNRIVRGAMLLGRDSEVRRVVALLDEVRESKPRTLVVTGDPGIGKSALLARAAEQATGFRRLTAIGVRSVGERPYAGLRTLLRSVMDTLEHVP